MEEEAFELILRVTLCTPWLIILGCYLSYSLLSVMSLIKSSGVTTGMRLEVKS